MRKVITLVISIFMLSSFMMSVSAAESIIEPRNNPVLYEQRVRSYSSCADATITFRVEPVELYIVDIKSVSDIEARCRYTEVDESTLEITNVTYWPDRKGAVVYVTFEALDNYYNEWDEFEENFFIEV